MKKKLLTILSFVLILGVSGFFLAPHTAHAALLDFIPISWVGQPLAILANFLLGITSWFVTVTGTFLNLSIWITTHIKNFYTQVSGIQAVWVTIRDLSSIAIIFMLLYSAITMILNVEGPKFGKLIVSIFLAGVFINFSLFFVKVAVDVSNLVSLQFYEAIAPQSQNNGTVAQAFNSGGISNVFMNSLRLPTIYKDTSFLKTTDISAAIILGAVGGLIMMITAGLSFLAAAVAFTIRTGILLFAMALSPIYFVAKIFPALQKKSNQYMAVLQGQLIFMPVYLALMYVALRIISDPMFMKIFNPPTTAVGQSGALGAVSIGVIVQYTIAIIFINAPLVAAISLSGTGGWGMNWAPGAQSVAGFFGRKFIGGAGGKLGTAFDNMAARAQGNAAGRAASSVLRTFRVSQSVRTGLSNIEKSKFGGSYTRAEVKEQDKKRKAELAQIGRTNRAEEQIDAVTGTDRFGRPNKVTDPKVVKDFITTVGKLTTKELEEMELDRLKNPQFLAMLSSKQFDGLMESKTLPEDQKATLKDERKMSVMKYLTAIIDPSVPNDVIKDYMKNVSGKELAGLPRFVWDNDRMIDHLRIPQMTEMKDLLDRSDRQKIGRRIIGLGANSSHHAAGWINKQDNRRDWS